MNRQPYIKKSGFPGDLINLLMFRKLYRGPNQDYETNNYFSQLPCPDCGNTNTITIVYFMTEKGAHQHTWYVCTFWGSKSNTQCGWTGFTVPGWNK